MYLIKTIMNENGIIDYAQMLNNKCVGSHCTVHLVNQRKIEKNTPRCESIDFWFFSYLETIDKNF